MGKKKQGKLFTGQNAPNPFEIRANKSRKKFEVLNRRVKGENRNVAHARAQAIERRKKTLLVDYQETKKSNSFKDRRFGEHDASIPLEEKLLARFQKERVRKARQSAFRLDDEEDNDDELLTHKGQVIGDDYRPEPEELKFGSDDEEQQMDPEAARALEALHFGGGPNQPSRHSDEKTRRDVIDEIIAKSKVHKLEKARNKEAQEGVVELLDDAFPELQQLLTKSSLLRPTGRDRERPKLDDFGLLAREIAFEAKAQATDRIKTEEEVAKEEHEKLEALEKKRLARMKGQFEESDSDDGAKKKSKKQKGPKSRTDDDIDDDFELDPRFGLKHGSTLEDGEESGDGQDETENETEEEEDESRDGSENEDEAEAGDSGQSAPEDEEEDGNGTQNALRQKEIKPLLSQAQMPFVFDCPRTLEDLLALFTMHAKGTDDVCMIVARIIKCNNIKLAAENREKMHNFYHLLLRRFVMVGDSIVQEPARSKDAEIELDFLTKTIVQLTRQMAEVAATLWCRTLCSLHSKLGKALRDTAIGMKKSCWPSVGHLLLLRLLGHTFPSSDLRHPVVTPAMLLLGQLLAQCPVSSACDLGSGMFCCSLMLEYSKEGRKVAPEVLAFLQGVLTLFTPPRDSPEDASTSTAVLPNLQHSTLTLLRVHAAGLKNPCDKIKLCWLSEEKPCGEELELFASATLLSCYKLVEEYADVLEGCLAFSELFGPLERALKNMQILEEPKLPLALAERHVSVAEKLRGLSLQCRASRKPLCWQLAPKKQVKMMTPKFDENYTVRKDKDGSTAKAKTKQLKRQVKREKKGAMRELRKDAEFLAQIKWKETQVKSNEKKRKIQENMAWLEQEAANFNKQVKLGGSLLKGGGSGFKKFKR